ncbi:LysR family transcriptional regulator [Sulfitobacter sp. 20_GPM-1509m]|uniref:LysR family transcriptional regulator n=1 Tax=Sulfitobacter sp. 20_GPM-1509m TaxID=1380367 RepID=UPI00048C298A|nr:LysR family transcriptional regulator [Sulfitobacter sp. 20_GPM-1509m]|tara:strand:- start:43141 stop:44043 length:903 start_codon:yes stop_codon:yes gene_type:complete
MIKSQITLKQLEAFVGVVDLGSFRKAASVLGTTQPNISNRISTLEETLGVILMHRDAGSVRQTEKGAALLAIARQILWNAEAFLEAAERQDLVDDRLRLGVTELIACTWLHRFLRRFREVYPSVSVELEVGLTGEIEKKLATGQIDLALQTGSFDREAGRTIHLRTYPYIWVAAPALAEANGTNRSMVNLLKGPVLTHGRNTVASKELARYAEAKRLAMNQVVYSSSLASSVQMTVDGMGFALLPAALVRDQLQSKSLVEIDIEWLPSPLEFYARFNPRRVPRFVEIAAGYAAEIANSRS